MYFIWFGTTARHPRGLGFAFSRPVAAAEARDLIRTLYRVREPLTALRPGVW